MPILLDSSELPLLVALILVAVATVFIGIGKAGLGGGVGLISPALYAQVMPMREVLGLMQPLLMAGDLASLVAWWRQWDVRNVLLLMPGTVLGVVTGIAIIARLPNRHLQIGLGIISLAFVLLQLLRQRGALTGAAFRPVWWHAALVGLTAGVCSTLAHAAGPIITLYLMPQNLGKERFVATTVLYFAILNLLKLPFFLHNGVLTARLALSAAWLVPLVVLGAVLGVWINRRVSETLFAGIVYAVVVLTAVKLLLG
ncbi:MAG: sulfite exporter TauE/SafE family protein [Armatimonadetes bacterium]|nr:sulfite exporter TauE/SafE family protein [Armatimonadota bacterium]